jgi:DNA replication protein DnaC
METSGNPIPAADLVAKLTSIKAAVPTPTPSNVVNTIETAFDPSVHPEAAQALNAVQAWRAALDSNLPPRWLSLLGKAGTGKTMLAKAAVTNLKQGPQLFRTWSKICDWLAHGEWEILDLMKTQRILVLDDITRPYDSNTLSAFDANSKGMLIDLLDDRLGKWTILTDNRPLREIAEFDTRIASRMLRAAGDGRPSVVVEFRDCPDYSAARRARGPLS